MLEKVEEVKAAVAQINNARLTMWNACLDLAIRMGDASRVDQLLTHVLVADGGGCGCGCGCGGSSEFRGAGTIVGGK